jgi:N-acyl-D-aspartate/D-glutamate deacylase
MASADYDLVVRGGSLIDGTGAPARSGDVGVRGGRIEALGEVRGGARRTIDAAGCVVAPGFIDIHTHYDAQLFWDRMLSISPWHGVTSVVIGNCGFGIAPTRPEHRDLILRTLENVEGMSLEAMHEGIGADWPFKTFPEYLDAVERRGIAINLGALVGHTPVRTYVMGEESTEREATPAEIAEMARIVEEAVRAGALGFATSKAPTHVGYAGRPVPSRAASVAEIGELADAMARVGRGVMQATIGRGFFLSELAAIQQRTGRTVSWTALLTGMLGPDGHRRVLEEHEKLQAQGIQVIPQVACRPLYFEYQWKAPFPFESLALFKPVSAADFEGKQRIYADPSFRAAFREEGGHRPIAGKWEDTVITVCPTEPALEERTVAEVARERGVHPVDLALDLGLASKLEARFRVAALNTDEDAVAEMLQHPGVVLGLSDAGAHASQLCDACFSTHLLSRFVRERKTLTLEEAVRMLTSRPAEVFGILDRGTLAPGLAADLVVFDPDSVGCSPLRRVHDLPAGADRLVSEARGIRAVIVNGTPIRMDGDNAIDPEGPLPGRVLRGGRAN